MICKNVWEIIIIVLWVSEHSNSFSVSVDDYPEKAELLNSDGSAFLAHQKIKFSVSNATTDNIFLYYFKGPTVNDYNVLKLEDGLSLTEQENFDINCTTIFLYHGWGENATLGSSQVIAKAMIQAKVCNFVVFDYSKLVRSNSQIVNYVISVFNATRIGQAIGEFFKQYVPRKQPIHLIKMVSHSLGSQIMAQVGRVYGIGKFPHFTGLDPAGPYYNIPGIKHLEAKDAIFVDVIHTDADFFGDGRSIGTVDFFPNHGHRNQPGCHESIFDPLNDCSHQRSFYYYAESVLNHSAFLAKSCSRTLFFNFCCCKNLYAYMGYNVNTSIHGDYWLTTNSVSPFGKGANGTKL